LVSLIVAGCGAAPAAPEDGGAPDLGPPLVGGARLYAGRAHVAGVTSDGWVAVLDDDRGALAVSLSGAGVQVIDPAAEVLVVSGRLILAARDYDPLLGVGDATLWSAAGGARPLTSAWLTSQQASSDDGKHLVLADHLSADGKSADLAYVTTATGARVTLFAQISEVGSCHPRFGFADGRFVVTHCAAGTQLISVSSIDAANGAITDLQTPAKNLFSIDRANKRVLVTNDAGGALLVPIAGGAATPLGAPPGVVFGELTSDGSAAILRTGSSLLRAPADGSAALDLVPGGVNTVLGTAPDSRHIIFGSNFDPHFGYTDLILASTEAAGSPVTLSAATDGMILAGGFTTDGSRAVYLTGAGDLPVGALESQPVGGGAPTVHGAAVARALAAGGTRLVFNDHFFTVPKQGGRADLLVADSASGAAPTLLATRADELFFLAAARSQVVYAFNEGGPLDGVYLATLP